MLGGLPPRLFRCDNLELSVQADIFRTRAYHHLELSRLYDKVHASIPKGKVIRPQHEIHCFGFTGQQADSLKPAQVLLVGRDTTNQVASIKLHDFIAFARAAVFHIDADRDIAAETLHQRTNAQVAVCETRIAQTIAEIVESTIHARLLALPLSIRLGGKIKRDLADGTRNSYSQLSARIVIAKQNVCDRGPCLRAGEPGLDNARHVLVDPVNAHWPAINQDHDYGFAGSLHGPGQIQLSPRQVETGARRTFADGLHRIAQHYDGQIRFFRRRNGFANLARFFARQWFGQDFRLRPVSIGDLTSFGIINFDSVTQF